MPVIGYLGSETPDLFATRLTAFRQGLGATGFDEGRNVAIEFRWADGQPDRLPALAADLVRRQVAVSRRPEVPPPDSRQRQQPQQFRLFSRPASTR
jgi:hypothetical protein